MADIKILNNDIVSFEGTVGIGTNSPNSSRLHISKTDQANELVRIRVENALGTADFGTQSGYTRLLSNGVLLWAGNSGQIYSYINSNVRSTLNATGFGIGTTNPAVPLHVVGTGRFTGGYLDVGHGIGTNEVAFTLGQSRTANGYAYIDLVGDTTYTDFGLRIIRGNGGPNSYSDISHRGTEDLRITTIDAADIKLRTNGTERVTIDSSGNVGINTTDPGNYKLYVTAGSATSVVANFYNPNAGYASILLSHSTGSAGIASVGNNLVTTQNFVVGGTAPFTTGGTAEITSQVDATNKVALSLGFSNTNMSYIRQQGNGIFQWQTYNSGNSGELHLQPYGGNVGIGTTSPSAKLNVVASNNTTAVSIDIGANAHFDFSANSTSGYTANFNIDDTGLDIGHNSTSRSLNLITGNSDRLTILGNGNVGIGTTSPNGSRFHVHQPTNLGGTANDTLLLRSLSNTGGTGGNNLYVAEWARRDGTGTNWTTWRYHNGIYIDASYQTPGTNTRVFWERDPHSAFQYFGSGSNYTLTIDGANDRVGIGTTSPQAKLTINGGVNNVWSYSTANTDQAGFVAADNVDYASHTNLLYNKIYGSGITATAFGQTLGNWAVTATSGSSNNGLLVGTFSNKPVIIGTNSAARMTITNTGNVGIGTTSPSEKLQVNGNLQFASNPTIYWNSNQLTLATKTNSIPVLALNGSTTYNPRFDVWNAGNTTVVNSINSGGNSYFNGGNVGIGTATPTYKLTVDDDTAYGGVLIQGRNAPGLTLLDESNGTSKNLIYAQSTASVQGVLRLSADDNNVGTDSSMEFRVDGSECMRIDTGGNVGIGTTSPSTKLHINSSGDEIARFESTTTTQNPYISIYQAGTRRSFIQHVDSGDMLSLASEYGGVRFLTGTGGAEVERMRITSAGSVGIGETSVTGGDVSATAPRLHVRGVDTAGSYHLVGRFQAGNDSDNTGAAILINHSNDRGLLIRAGRKDSDRGVAYFDVTSSAGGTTNMLTMGKYDSDHFVGIKTETPEADLDVNGVIVSRGGSYNAGTDNNGNVGLVIQEGDYIYTEDDDTYLRKLIGKGTSDIIEIGQSGTSLIDGVNFFSGVSCNYRWHNNGSVAMLLNSTGLQIGNTNTTYALDVTGTIRASGDVIAYSDARVKENVKTIDNALDKVTQLRGVSYNKIGETEEKIGVIAQEIEKVLPQVVQEDDNGMKSVAYGNIVGVLIEAIKEQQKQIDELKALLNGSTK